MLAAARADGAEVRRTAALTLRLGRFDRPGFPKTSLKEDFDASLVGCCRLSSALYDSAKIEGRLEIMQVRRLIGFALALLGLAGGVTLFWGKASAATVRVDRATKFQTIEGFGFFGGRDIWWEEDPSTFASPEWIQMVIDDLGASLWRNEYYPPSIPEQSQVDWLDQRPVVIALRDQAKKSGAKLKVLVTVWSAPASLKCASSITRVEDGVPHRGGTKQGGAVCPSKQVEFADWLIAGLEQYAAAGIEVVGLSFQNEPLFAQSFNSGVYPYPYYAALLAEIGPRIRLRFPDVKLFGPEHLLERECEIDGEQLDPDGYTGSLLKNPAALAQLGAFAVHGYSDGVLATPSSRMARLWANYYDAVKHTEKPVWMTETSGYVDSWEGGRNSDGEERPGAFELAQAIFAALYYGKATAWLWWQGSELGGFSEFNLMHDTRVAKRYFVSKHFYRFLRPGARMVAAQSDDRELLAAAFEHSRIGNFVTILINGGATEKRVAIEGTQVQSLLTGYRTSASEDFVRIENVSQDNVSLPPRSLTTLIHGAFTDAPAGSGGGAGAGIGGGGRAGSASIGGTSGPAGFAGIGGAGSVPVAGRGGAASGVGGSLPDSPLVVRPNGSCGCRVTRDRLAWFEALLPIGVALVWFRVRRRVAVSASLGTQKVSKGRPGLAPGLHF